MIKINITFNKKNKLFVQILLVIIVSLIFISSIKIVSLLSSLDKESSVVITMINFLEHFIVYWLYLNLFIIIVYLLYLYYINHNGILIFIKKNKIIFFLLLIFFLTGTALRFSFVSTFFLADESSYNLNAKIVFSSDYFNYFNSPRDRDSPGFSVIVSLFMKIFGVENIGVGHVNALFGSLSIIMIFIMVQLFFNNPKISLISALFLTFNPLHLEYSVRGYPAVTSIFFCIILLILFIKSLKIQSSFSYPLVGLTLGFTAQFYYIEIILVLPLILYFFIKREFNQNNIIKSTLIFLGIIISILPFVILSNISQESYNSENNLITDLVCVWTPGKCGFLNIDGSKSTDKFINHIDNKPLSYLGYLFIGMSTKSNYDTNWRFDGWLPYTNNYNLVNNETSYIYFLSTFFIIIGFFLSKYYKLEWIFFFLVMSFFIIGFSTFYDHPMFHTLYMIILGIIPLTSVGIVKSINLIRNNTFRYLLVIILSLIIISPFITENVLDNLEITRGDNLKQEWDKINQILLYGDKEGCDELSSNKLRLECKNWLLIHKIIEEKDNCGRIKNEYFKERCWRRMNLYYQLDESIKKI